MRELQFKNFLSKYANQLSYDNTNNYNKLLFEAEHENYRLREVLLLLLVEKNLLDKYHKKLSKYSNLYSMYKNNETYFINRDYNNKHLEESFRKVYHSYQVQRDMHKNEEHVKKLMLNRLLQLKKEKHVSTYALYKNHNLNPGNVNYALKHKDVTKLSYSNLSNMLNFVESL